MAVPKSSQVSSTATFFETIRQQPGGTGKDIASQLLLALRSGPVPVAALLSYANGSPTALSDALSRLSNLGFVTLSDLPEGKVATLTNSGTTAADLVAHGS